MKAKLTFGIILDHIPFKGNHIGNIYVKILKLLPSKGSVSINSGMTIL